MKKYLMLTAVAALLGLNSCHDKFLEEEPYNFLTPQNFYSNAKDAEAAVNAVYRSLYENDNNYYGYNLLALTEISTEAVTSILHGKTVDHGRLDLWQTQVGDEASIYSTTFKIVNRANSAIDNVPNIAMDETLKKRIIAEARFLRAFAYFNGVRIYGDLPLVLNETTSIDGLLVEATPAATIYEQVIQDLMYAKDNLPSVKTYSAAQRGRVGRSAAKTLLAKVYLTRGSTPTLAQGNDFKSAATLLREVIGDGDHALVPSYADLWDYTRNENNSEVIFDIQLTRINGLGGRLTRQLATANTGNIYDNSYTTMSAELDFYKSYEPGDTRLDVTFDNSFIKNGEVIKFDPANPNNGFPQETPGFRKNVDFDKSANLGREEPNFVILRYADVLLMLAEAIVKDAKAVTPEAFELVNKVRRRAFGKSLTTPDDKIDLAGLDYNHFLRTLLAERRKEFVVEGHGWFDGMRFYDIFLDNIAQSSIGGNPNSSARPKEVIERSRIADPKYRLFPIPLDALERNPKLKQNPGW